MASHLSNEKRAPGRLGYIGDEILPRFFWDYNSPLFSDPKKTNQDDPWKVIFGFFFVAHFR